jgi:hypothetical protein
VSGGTQQHDELLTLSEVAAELRVSPEQVRSLCTSGALPFIVVSPPGKDRVHRRVRRETLEHFKRNEQVCAAAAEQKQIASVSRRLASVEQIW